MSGTFVLSGLKSKRAELDGLIEHHRREIADLIDALNHVDATIRIFDPEFNPRSIPRKVHRKKNVYFKQGECARLVLDVLRVAEVPLSTDAIAFEIMDRKHMDSNDPEVVRFAKKATITALGQQRTNGMVQQAGLLPDGITYVWHLSNAQLFN